MILKINLNLKLLTENYYYGFKKLICDTKTREECIEKYKSFYPKKQYLKFKIVALKLVWKLQNEE